MRSDGKQKKYFILSGFVALIILTVAGVYYFVSSNEENKPKADKPEAPLHRCNVGKFTQNLNKGASTTFFVILYPSQPEREYRLKPSGFPPGIKGKLSEEVKDGQVRARVDINATEKARPGSYTMAIIYEEEDEDGEFVYNDCKYNLIINN